MVNEFIPQVAAIFEENCLPLINAEDQVELAILIATDYCLEKLELKEKD